MNSLLGSCIIIKKIQLGIRANIGCSPLTRGTKHRCAPRWSEAGELRYVAYVWVQYNPPLPSPSQYTLVTCIAQPGGSTNKLYYVFIVCVICRLILVLYICILTSLSWFAYYVKTVVLLSTIHIYSFSSFVSILPVAIQPLWMRTKLNHVCTDEVNMNESWSDSPPLEDQCQPPATGCMQLDSFKKTVSAICFTLYVGGIKPWMI